MLLLKQRKPTQGETVPWESWSGRAQNCFHPRGQQLLPNGSASRIIHQALGPPAEPHAPRSTPPRLLSPREPCTTKCFSLCCSVLFLNRLVSFLTSYSISRDSSSCQLPRPEALASSWEILCLSHSHPVCQVCGLLLQVLVSSTPPPWPEPPPGLGYSQWLPIRPPASPLRSLLSSVLRMSLMKSRSNHSPPGLRTLHGSQLP